MNKLDFIKSYFEKWDADVKRAELLMKSDDHFLEGLIVIVCYIGALGALRYPGTRDWKSYREIIFNYSDNTDIFENIDVLHFYQFKNSKNANEDVYG